VTEPLETLAGTYREYERVALVASFQAESCVLIDMACSLGLQPDVLTLDTGRLPEETHELMAVLRKRYPIRLHVIQPDADEVEAMVAEHGTNLFLRSVELRLRCCDVRKSRPLERALLGYDAWITGVRRQQSPTRANTQIVSQDPVHGGIAKVAPLADWTHDQVWDYMREHGVPEHALYSRGYTSIGCAPCTRPTEPGEDERAGRWWWEQDGIKECGLHWREKTA
jgi:thioredoxin-dependent adenylylsulfate APS reductase